METTIKTDMSREKAKIKLTITKVPTQLRNLDIHDNFILKQNMSGFMITWLLWLPGIEKLHSKIKKNISS